MKRLAALFALATPLFAQYAGPAILSRGEAPSAMNGPSIDFRPFVEVSGVYNTGLSSVSVDSQGNIANQSSAGLQFAGGISGSHRWRHTEIGLSYRGSYSDYFRNSKYNSTDQSLLLGIQHQISRHVSLSVSNSFGVINRDYGLLSTISSSVTFDPSTAYVPATDFFNNRTISASSMANLVIQRSTRMSYSFGGGIFTNNRSSSALYGVTGLSAHGDVQYRFSRRLTLGGNYSYARYLYSGLTNSTDAHTVAGTAAYQINRWWEATGSAGASRIETKFIQNVAVDPAIAAIIGITESSEVIYSQRTIPSLSGRLSRTFRKGVLYFNASHGMSPGNGLFLTSTMTNVGGGYTYTGLRKWSFGVNSSYQRSESIGNVSGEYGSVNTSANFSRQIAHSLHVVGSVTEHRYTSGDFTKYNQTVYSASIGLGWSPGAVPLRIW